MHEAARQVDAPIGLFDSGSGGLSILQALHAALPAETFVYLADAGRAPYGERGDDFVRARSLAIVRWLRHTYCIKMLVVACNTATTAAIDALRMEHSDLDIVGVEPAVKPAQAQTRTGRIGVIGTRGTLASMRFQTLLDRQHPGAEFVIQPCDGLAGAIDAEALDPTAPCNARDAGTLNAPETIALIRRHLSAMGRFGTEEGDIDTLVLGCTHYIFATSALRMVTGPEVRYLEPGAPVARQAARLLTGRGMTLSVALPAGAGSRLIKDVESTQTPAAAPALRLLSTGDPLALQAAAARWLGLRLSAESAVIP